MVNFYHDSGFYPLESGMEGGTPEMRKRFNVTGLCVPRKHYMVNLADRLAQVKEMVEEGAYFTIHRARRAEMNTI